MESLLENIKVAATSPHDGASPEDKVTEPSIVAKPLEEKVGKLSGPLAVFEKDGTSGQPEDTSLSPAMDKNVNTRASTLARESRRDGPLTNIEKKRRRAERFGTELRISEEEKRRIRIARFGSGPAAHDEKEDKKSEAEKMRARAARFGIADEESKKKARIERFGKDPQYGSSLEIERRAVWAARFMSGLLAK